MKLTRDEIVLAEWAINEALITARNEMAETRHGHTIGVISREGYEATVNHYRALKELYHKVRKANRQ